jgi:hypothetical protein
VDALLAAGGARATLPLFRKQGLVHGVYKPQLGVGGAPSTVIVSAVMSDVRDDDQPDAAWRQGIRRVCIRIHAALNLRSADLVGRNDVYCQLYEVEPTQGALPDPPKSALMPVANELVVPFSFTLPVNCPSSLERIPGCDYGVRFSLFCGPLPRSPVLTPSTVCALQRVRAHRHCAEGGPLLPRHHNHRATRGGMHPAAAGARGGVHGAAGVR